MWIVNHVCDKAGEDYMMCVCVCKSVRGREKELLWTMRQDGGWLTILKRSHHPVTKISIMRYI